MKNNIGVYHNAQILEHIFRHFSGVQHSKAYHRSVILIFVRVNSDIVNERFTLSSLSLHSQSGVPVDVKIA